jgi:hypothetical protein
LVELALDAKKAEHHPAFMLKHTKCIDNKTGDTFEFRVSDEDLANEVGWSWQRSILDWWMGTDKTIVLKARQLGVTWLSSGLALWYLLYRPGSKVLAVSINEEEASKVVNRTFDQMLSLPKFFLRGTELIKPSRGHRPYTEIQLRHPDGRISSMIALASTKKAGHGETAALVILDEFSRQDYARETWKAIIPTMADGGRVVVISTANGVSNDLTGEGNFYHHLWVHADDYGLEHEFLKWDLHPDRDDEWYRKNASALPAKDRAEQYPNDEHEAFILTGDLFFDAEGLNWYSKKAIREPVMRGWFRTAGYTTANFVQKKDGWIRIYEPPTTEDVVIGEANTQKVQKRYAIACDVSTGHGLDYSCAYVIDLSTMAFVAELHAKLDSDQLAEQLHFLGRWYNTALIAVEKAGGYGDSVMVSLRDGTTGRPKYPKLYRHRQYARPDQHENRAFGFPTNSSTRPQILNGLEAAIREKAIPFVSHGLLQECQTFVYAKTAPSPRAQDGTNDDRVMAAAIGVELFRQYGAHPQKPKRTAKRKRIDYPWELRSSEDEPLSSATFNQ